MKTAVLLSGGVDSSVVLRLLQDDGQRDLTAFYLKIWLEDELSHLGECPWETDLEYAREVCETAGVPLEIVSLQTEYYQRVVTYAVAELREGRTPSPDIFCNQRIKFGAFFERIDPSCRVATGHYARISERLGLFHLERGVDRVKDQTYFLSHMNQAQLGRSLFPIGHLTKREVRRLADAYGLPNRQRKDSQGICFLGKIKFDEFVRSNLGERAGEIRERESGRVLGEHRGYWFHTVGQRRGLGLSRGPWYVVGKDLARNVVYVSHQETLERHARRTFRVEAPHWIAGPPAASRLGVKLRHSEHIDGCELVAAEGDALQVTLDAPDSGVAPGQFAVFYDGETCLGGARIL
ncbi:MAG: tRNA 2-thiouridine(34) synthase MnmA [Planctomycetota bacterium]|nr:tRNA 2-thiouridine(34) synthase MnmA [Planctomycetota bacterium]